MQSKSCFNLQKLAADMPFSGCPRSLVRLSSTRSSRSGGLVLALGDADADGILNRKTDRHAELEGILIYMGDKDHRLVAGCYRTAAPTCRRVTRCCGVLGTVLDEACGRVS